MNRAAYDYFEMPGKDTAWVDYAIVEPANVARVTNGHLKAALCGVCPVSRRSLMLQAGRNPP